MVMKDVKTNLVPYAFLAPALIILTAFIAYPVAMNLFMSMWNVSLLSTDSYFVGMKNFKVLLSDVRVWEAIKRTFIWTGINILFALPIGLGSAMLLSTKFKGANLLNAFVLIPWILPSVVTGYIFALMFSEDAGVFTWIIKSLGIVAKDFSWFRTGSTAMAAAIIANVWRAFPFFTLMLYAKISAVPNDHIEAAFLEGATASQRFSYIIFPYIFPVLLTCTYLCFIWTFNAYDIIKIMTNGGPAELTTTMSIMVQREAFQFFSLSTASAMSIIMFVLMFSIILIAKGILSIMRKVRG